MGAVSLELRDLSHWCKLSRRDAESRAYSDNSATVQRRGARRRRPIMAETTKFAVQHLSSEEADLGMRDSDVLSRRQSRTLMT